MEFIGIELDRESKQALKAISGSVAKGRKELNMEIAQHWHAEIFPSHFTPGAESRYSYEPRTKWTKRKKLQIGTGQGKYVSDVLRGKSQRMMQQLATASGTAGHVTVKMPAPAYFTHPFIGDFVVGRHKVIPITRQPDKPAEVTRVSAADMTSLRIFANRRLQELVDGAKSMGGGI